MMEIRFSKKKFDSIFLSEDKFHSFLAQGCTSDFNCRNNEICSSGVCHPNPCSYTGQCAYGSTCIGGRCQGNMFRYSIRIQFISGSVPHKYCPLHCAHVGT